MQSCMAPPGNNAFAENPHEWSTNCSSSVLLPVKEIVKPKLYSFLVVPHQQLLNDPPNNSFQFFPSSLSLFLPHVVSQAVSGGSQLVRAGVHDGDAGLLAVRDHTHTHHQPTLRHHGLLPPAAQQAQQEPERSQGQQGSHLIFEHPLVDTGVFWCQKQTSGSLYHRSHLLL